MTRLAVLLPLAAVIWVAFPLAIARFLRGPKTEEREALGSDICKDGVHPDECPSCLPSVRTCSGCNVGAGGRHPDWCPSRPVGPTVVAGSDLDPLEALYRAPAFNGERAS